jgi:glycosyltransferase involved in cell wall biosynthesis/peptidoglycan/xylan/chitin deacetylase (PgdA/CDA1 family)
MVGRSLKPVGARLLFSSGLVSLKRAIGPRNRAIVLMYHRVNDAQDSFFPALPVRVFARQLDYLQKRYRIEPLESVMEWVERGGSGGPRVALTIDDGFPDTYENVFPELVKRNLTATLFLSTAPLETGRPLWTERLRFAFKHTSREEIQVRALALEGLRLGDRESRIASLKKVLRRLKKQTAQVIEECVSEIERKLAPAGPSVRVLSWDQVREMTRGGHVRIGGHSHTHYILSRLDDGLLEKEIVSSVGLVESRLGTKVETFCYPNGRPEDYDARAAAVLKTLGIRYAFTATSSDVRKGADPYQLPRLYTSEPHLPLFAARLAGLSTRVPAPRPAAPHARSSANENGHRRVGYIVSQFPCYDETFILREIKALRDRGLDIAIFSLRAKRQAATQEDAHALLPSTRYAPFLSPAVARAVGRALLQKPGPILRLAFELASDLFRHPLTLAKSLAFLPKTIYFAELAREASVTHLHAHWATYPATAALLMSRLTGVPWSFTCHAHDIFADPILLPKKLKTAAFALTCTRHNRDYLASLDGVGPGRVHLSYHGLDLKRFRPVSKPPPNGHPLRILAVGSLLECKGFRHLIEACRLLAARGLDFRATIAGGGPLEEELRGLVSREGLQDRVQLTGFVTEGALVPLYQAADVFVLPALPEIHWGIPNVLIEALACEIPVVTTPLPSVSELVEHGRTGLLIEEPDPERIASSVESLARDPEMRARMGRQGRARVEQAFDLDRNIEAIVERLTAG